MKIVFLDFDGVLNSTLFFIANPGAEICTEEQVDPAAVARLNTIVSVSKADVVVSSTWRLHHDAAYLQRILDMRGFRGKVIDTTPVLHHRVRGREIQAWLNWHPETEKFVILDDDSDMEHLSDRLIKTAFVNGLQDVHVGKALQHLL